MMFTSGTQARQGRRAGSARRAFARIQMPMCQECFGTSRHAFDCSFWNPESAVLDNPILADVRFHLEHRRTDTVGDVYREWFSYVENEDPAEWSEDVTPEQLDHARKVLTRLAQWKEN